MPIKSDQELLEESQNKVDSSEASNQGSGTQKSSDWRWIFLGAISPLLLGLVGFGIYTAVTPKSVPVNIIVQAPSPSPANSPSTSSTSSPTTQQSSPLSPSSSPIITTSPTTSSPGNNTTSPEDIVRTYYDNIKSGRYSESWNMLPTSMQKDQSLHPNGYASFRDWWTKTNVDVDVVRLAESSSTVAVVDVDVRFTANRGNPRPLHTRYFFTKDPVSNSWTISKIKLR